MRLWAEVSAQLDVADTDIRRIVDIETSTATSLVQLADNGKNDPGDCRHVDLPNFEQGHAAAEVVAYILLGEFRNRDAARLNSWPTWVLVRDRHLVRLTNQLLPTIAH